MGLTVDEGAHMRYGLQILSGDSSRFDDSKMPVTALNALPTKVAEILQKIFPSLTISPIIFYYGIARIPTMLFSLIIMYLVYRQTRRVFSSEAGLLAAFLFSVCPNIMAHSRLITNDVYAMGGIFLSVYCLSLYIEKRTVRNLLFLSLAVAFAMISKFTSVFLYPLLFLIIFFRYNKTVWILLRRRNFLLARFARRAVFHFAIFAFANLFLINAAYFFNGSLKALRSYEFKSEEFRKIASLPLFSSLPFPFPAPMIEGFDWIAYNQATGETFGNIYLLGKVAARGEGFKTYYLIVWLFKIPIGLQILFYTAITYYLYKNSRRKMSILKDKLFLFFLLPAVYFFVLLSFVLKAQLGVRYFLICLPFIIIFSSGVCYQFLQNFRFGRILIIIISLAVFISGLTYYPHYISYFNELSFDRKNNWRILADSNLDWGEKKDYLLDYALKNPEIIYNPDNECFGHIVVDANKLAGVTAPPEKFAWLRKYEPESHIAYSYIVLRIK